MGDPESGDPNTADQQKRRRVSDDEQGNPRRLGEEGWREPTKEYAAAPKPPQGQRPKKTDE